MFRSTALMLLAWFACCACGPDLHAQATRQTESYKRLKLKLDAEAALRAGSGEVAAPIGSESRTLETEAGDVSWKEPKAYLPKSRKV